MRFKFFNYCPSLIRLFVENDGFKANLVDKPCYRLARLAVVTMDDEHSIGFDVFSRGANRDSTSGMMLGNFGDLLLQPFNCLF